MPFISYNSKSIPIICNDGKNRAQDMYYNRLKLDLEIIALFCQFCDTFTANMPYCIDKIFYVARKGQFEILGLGNFLRWGIVLEKMQSK